MKAIINARIVLEDRIIENAALLYDKRICEICTDSVLPDADEVINAGNRLLLPGLIDLHMHGYYGREVAEATPEAIRHMSANLLRDGVTGYLATLGSMPLDNVARAMDAIRVCMSDAAGAAVHGAHMEGVYISEEKRGAHDISLILPPDTDFLQPFADIIRIMICAPERYPEFVSWCVEKGIVAALGHSNATFEEAMEGIRRGATEITHLFNGMRSINHREIGIAGAALTSDGVNVELIADTVHVSRELYKLIYRAKGPDRILLITDSSIAAGMRPGVYTSNNRTIYVDECIGRLANGTISGSVTPLRRDLINFHKYSGAPLYEAVRMASLNPARVLKIDHETGSIRIGKRADMFIADENMNVTATFMRGECVYGRENLAALRV